MTILYLTSTGFDVTISLICWSSWLSSESTPQFDSIEGLRWGETDVDEERNPEIKIVPDWGVKKNKFSTFFSTSLFYLQSNLTCLFINKCLFVIAIWYSQAANNNKQQITFSKRYENRNWNYLSAKDILIWFTRNYFHVKNATQGPDYSPWRY